VAWAPDTAAIGLSESWCFRLQTDCNLRRTQREHGPRIAREGTPALRPPDPPYGVQTLACIAGPNVLVIGVLRPVSVSRMHTTLELRSRAV
jgi:hypothetical protein